MSVDYSVTKRQIELDRLNTVARIYRRGRNAYVNLITGREPHPTGKIVCIKAGMRALAWESIKAEKPMIELCEVATPVHRVQAQPHNLVMKVVAERYPWRYRPDLQLEVDRQFADLIGAGTPFAQAVADWRPTGKKADTVTMIVAVKDDDDPRIDDDRYNHKLRLAEEVYNSINWRFAIVVRSRDLDVGGIAKSVRSYMMDHDTSFVPADISLATQLISDCGGTARLRDIANVLGGGHIGKAKAAALHVRRIISVDLT
ncbi:MAG: hypothetical protein JWR51_4595 [Devosia sp.]|uniref:hypothetical protein n=1 Tax=Devosia sp. TaxID=1871048 RepID=UPI00262FC863|nr:hypothetical protein [Devosia sp.]MDB5531492.1 hypothetical protein [Devosia sp.]